MRIFLICPVRNVTPEYRAEIEAQVTFLEGHGHEVYWPQRDTHQTFSEHAIAVQNCAAMGRADEVHVIWDGKSEGVLFDLGMAFALRKLLHVVTGMMPNKTRRKSFQNLCYAWEEGGA